MWRCARAIAPITQPPIINACFLSRSLRLGTKSEHTERNKEILERILRAVHTHSLTRQMQSCLLHRVPPLDTIHNISELALPTNQLNPRAPSPSPPHHSSFHSSYSYSSCISSVRLYSDPLSLSLSASFSIQSCSLILHFQPLINILI